MTGGFVRFIFKTAYTERLFLAPESPHMVISWVRRTVTAQATRFSFPPHWPGFSACQVRTGWLYIIKQNPGHKLLGVEASSL